MSLTHASTVLAGKGEKEKDDGKPDGAAVSYVCWSGGSACWFVEEIVDWGMSSGRRSSGGS